VLSCTTCLCRWHGRCLYLGRCLCYDEILYFCLRLSRCFYRFCPCYPCPCLFLCPFFVFLSVWTVSDSEGLSRVNVGQSRSVQLISDVIQLLAGSPRFRVVLSVSVVVTIPDSISCAICVTLSVSVSISLVVSDSLTTTFLVSTALASTIVVVTDSADSRVLEISHLDVIEILFPGVITNRCVVQRIVDWLIHRHEAPRLSVFLPNARSLL
jgi:hypothetical protein